MMDFPAQTTGLSFLGSVDAEQADELTTELHGIAVRDPEAMRDSRAVGI
jgi:predicted aconitase with swiveling domain